MCRFITMAMGRFAGPSILIRWGRTLANAGLRRGRSSGRLLRERWEARRLSLKISGCILTEMGTWRRPSSLSRSVPSAMRLGVWGAFSSCDGDDEQDDWATAHAGAARPGDAGSKGANGRGCIGDGGQDAVRV